MRDPLASFYLRALPYLLQYSLLSIALTLSKKALVRFLGLLLLRLERELEGVPHLPRRLARVLQQPLDSAVETDVLAGVACRLLLLVAEVDLLLLKKKQGLSQQ